MALPRLIIHKDEVNILFEPQERQVPVPSLYSLSRRKVAPIVNCDDIEAQTDIIEGSPKDNAAIETLKSLEEMANHLVSLPHMANHSFFSLSFIMSAILFGSAFLYMWIFAFPFHSVNAGLEENRAFFYGVLSYVEFLSLIPWIETVNYAMPEVKLPARSRVIAVLVGFLTQKVLDTFIAEGWWNTDHETFFPIPFSTIVTELLAVPAALATLFALHRKAFRGKALKCCWILMMYLVALFVAGSWAAFFNFLQGSRWQKAWALAFGPLRFVVKVLCIAPTALEINNKRWIFLTMIVDLIFARIQVGTLPFIHDWVTMIALLGGSFGTLAWRYYSGVDRFQLLFCPFWKRIKGDTRGVDSLRAAYGASPVDIFLGVGMASLKDIHDASARSRQRIDLNSITSPSSFVPDEIESCIIPSESAIVPDQSLHSVKEPERCTPHNTCSILAHGNTASGRLATIDEDDGSEYDSSQRSIAHLEERDEKIDEDNLDENIDEDKLDERIDEDKVDERIDEDEDDESIASFVDIDLEKCEPEVKEQPNREANSGCVEVSVIDRRSQWANTKLNRVASKKLQEDIWFQRQFYHIVDSVGSEILGLIVLMQHLAALWLGHRFPIHQHLNATFDITAEQWKQARIFGISSIIGDIIIIASLTVLYRRVKERPLTMTRVLSYIFRNNFWFFFLWITATGAYSCSTMINHFGADFTLTVEWRHCRVPGTMAWPGCV